MIKEIKYNRLRNDFYNMLDGLYVDKYVSPYQWVYRLDEDDIYCVSICDDNFQINYTKFVSYEHIFTRDEIIKMISDKLNTDNKVICIEHT